MMKLMLGMIHLKGKTPQDTLARAIEEARILEGEGFNGIIIENYFGGTESLEVALEEIIILGTKLTIGINVLGDNALAFKLSREYDPDFIQLDSVCGHLSKHEDLIFASNLKKERASTDSRIIGGVRFKYQPVLSGREEEADAVIGASRCDAIAVTGNGTGSETPTETLIRFRAHLGADVPLIVAAGLTAENVAEKMSIADGGIVGSWLKNGHKDSSDMSVENVKSFMKAYLNG